MNDPKLLRKDPHAVAAQLARRGFIFDAEAFMALEAKRKALQIETERLRMERNIAARLRGESREKDVT